MQCQETTMASVQGAGVASVQPSPPQMLAILSHGLPSLYRYANKFLRNQADAEDVVQDALLAAHTHLHQFRGDAQLSTWLMTILMNCVRMHLRRQSRHNHLSLDAPIGEEQVYPLSDILADNRPNPEDECYWSMLNAQLMKSVSRLSPTLRKTFHLRFVHQLSICETAHVLGVPSGTVKAQSARARAKLLKSLRETLQPRSRSGRRRR